MLKQAAQDKERQEAEPVAFGRLCVETFIAPENKKTACQSPSGGCVLKQDSDFRFRQIHAVAFGRLCVETPPSAGFSPPPSQSPSGGCVLKPIGFRLPEGRLLSRLRAAVC